MGKPRRASDVARALVAKGMTQDESHHHMYKKTVDGVTTLITKISHSADEIHDGLGTAMGRQCQLRLKEFWRLVDCPMSESEWDALVRQRCVDGRNPFMRR